MEYFFRQAPLLRVAFAFIAGIILESRFVVSEWPVVTLCLLLLILSFFLNLKKKSASLQHNIGRGLCINVLIFSLGYGCALLYDSINRKDHFSRFEEALFYRVSIDESPDAGGKTVKCKITFSRAFTADSVRHCSGRAILYLEKDSLSETLEYGDVVVVKAGFQETQGPKNPHEFDYKKYLACQNIHHQAFIKGDQWFPTGEFSGSVIYSHSQKVRTLLLSRLQNHIEDPEVLGVAKALILGYTKELTDEIRSAYAGTGAMHVLAVSGMHVGIIMLVFGFLTKPLLHWRKGLYIQAALTVIILWSYAFITGLSPSVQRAATMFSFVVLGKTFRRSVSIYNSLACSALFLLYINPFLLYQVGFQLSYLAVVGIVFFTPLIYELWKSKNRMADFFWELFSVSLAAQLVTFPLGLLCFHQFPNLFFLSNLLVIPLAAPIMYSGLTLIALADVPYFSEILAGILTGLIWFCNYVVKFIEAIPYSLSSGIILSGFQTLLVYGIIATSAAFLLLRRSYSVFSFLILSLLLGSSFLLNYLDRSAHARFHVYDVRGTSVMDIMKGNEVILLADTGLTAGEFDFHLKQNWWYCGFDPPQHAFWLEADFNGQEALDMRFLSYHGLHLGILGKDFRKVQLPQKVKLDILVLSHNPKISYSNLTECFEFRKLVLDSSNDYYWIKRFLAGAEEHKVHAVRLQGAFVYNF